MPALLDRAAGAQALDSLRAVPAYLWCLLLGIALNIFSGNTSLVGLPFPPDRLLLPGALALFLLDGRRRHARWRTVHWLMLAFVLWTVVSMAVNLNLDDSVSWFALLDRTLMPFLLFSLGAVIFDTEERRTLLLKTLVLIGAYLGITGVLEFAAPGLVWPSGITNPAIGLQGGRTRGPFLASDAMGVALIVSCFAAVLLAAVRPRWRVVSIVVVTLCVAGSVLTMTRAVWVALVVASVAGALMVPRLRAWIPLATGVAAVVALIVVAFVPSFTAAFNARSTAVRSIYDRLGSNDAALGVVNDMPLTGIGWRRFFPHGADWAAQTDTYPLNQVVIEIHNVVLSRMAELGVPAAVVFVLIMALGPGRLLVAPHLPGDLGLWRVFGFCVFLAWFVTGMFGPMSLPYPNYVVWLVAGVASAPYLTGSWRGPGAERARSVELAREPHAAPAKR